MNRLTAWIRRWFAGPPPLPLGTYSRRAYRVLLNIHPGAASQAVSLVPVWNSDASVWRLHAWMQHNIGYTPDGDGKDVWQVPDDTLQRGVGDCEDQALLLASMILAVAPDADKPRVRVVFGTQGRSGHATVAWCGDGGWYNADPTSRFPPVRFSKDKFFRTSESAGIAGVWLHGVWVD